MGVMVVMRVMRVEVIRGRSSRRLRDDGLCALFVIIYILGTFIVFSL